MLLGSLLWASYHHTSLAQTSPITFNARGLVAISDADMAASAFVDGKLLRDNSSRDMLTSVKFPLQRGVSVGQIPVPNSALTFSKSMAVPKNGGLAYVLEARTRPEDSVQEYDNPSAKFPAGQKLYVIDIVNLAAPKVKFSFNVGNNPTAVDLYKNELMIATSEPGKELVFLEVNDDGKPTRFAILPSGLDSTSRIIDLSWHPSGDFFAVTIEQTKQIALFKVIRDAGKLKTIEMVGSPIQAGEMPTYGRFSADGKRYFVVDAKGNKGKASANGELLVLELATDGTDHRVVSKIEVGLHPGAFSVSPDGGMLAVVSAEKTLTSWDMAGAGSGSKLALYKLAADGSLTKATEAKIDGILAQGVVFDKDGSNLAVSIYEYMDYGNRSGGIEFWSVSKGDAPALTKQSSRIGVERGAHTLQVIH